MAQRFSVPEQGEASSNLPGQPLRPRGSNDSLEMFDGDGMMPTAGESSPEPDHSYAQRAQASLFAYATNSASSSAPNMSLLCDEDDEVQYFEEASLASDAFPKFEEIRRLGKLCDVTLVVDDHRFSAHRVVLAATVPYFRAMFTSAMVEVQQNEINMHGIEPDTLEQLVNFAYSGKVRITISNVQSLMVGASFLQLENIVQACCQYLQSRLQGSNVLAVRQFASALGCLSLVRAADQFLQKHFVAISRTDDFFALPLEDVIAIISRDELHVSSEEQVFEAAMRWIRHDAAERKGRAADLLACIRLPLLKPQYITDCVASNEIVRGCLRCRDLVDEAKDYHLMPERRALLQTFRTKPRCCNDIPGIVYAVGGLTNDGNSSR
uniref:BTB domain-containing protein n=1 Tax=Plectus sambesii TaxID=2011161 RepID=A0A914XJ89_9BILA